VRIWHVGQHLVSAAVVLGSPAQPLGLFDLVQVLYEPQPSRLLKFSNIRGNQPVTSPSRGDHPPETSDQFFPSSAIAFAGPGYKARYR
jgi:hypothetical protein